jgi:NitT/TauT family transport system ATP-binding protein
MEQDIVLDVKGLKHWFGTQRVLFDISLAVVRGEIVALVGPSGCGKSTLLRAIVGTHPPREGELVVYLHAHNGKNGTVHGKRVTGPGRDRGIVYQQYSLFPFLTAQENVAFGLMLDETSLPYRGLLYPWWRRLRKEHLTRAAEYLEKVELTDAMKLYPSSMSGGMRQRVAVAQALIMKPEILLLDEPFGALDEATREELQKMLLTLYQENLRALREGRRPPYTMLIVTHEINEAIYVGDRVVGFCQHWDWKAEGHERCPGAAMVYDRWVPVEDPGELRNYETFAKQRKEVLDVVFYPREPVDRKRYCTFWDDVREGRAQGIFAEHRKTT